MRKENLKLAEEIILPYLSEGEKGVLEWAKRNWEQSAAIKKFRGICPPPRELLENLYQEAQLTAIDMKIWYHSFKLWGNGDFARFKTYKELRPRDFVSILFFAHRELVVSYLNSFEELIIDAKPVMKLAIQYRVPFDKYDVGFVLPKKYQKLNIEAPWERYRTADEFKRGIARTWKRLCKVLLTNV